MTSEGRVQRAPDQRGKNGVISKMPYHFRQATNNLRRSIMPFFGLLSYLCLSAATSSLDIYTRTPRLDGLNAGQEQNHLLRLILEVS